MRRTKIICTIGPATRNPEMLERLINSGMNVARINFAHGTRDEHARVITDIRSLADKLNRPVAILQDLAGPKVRTGSLADGLVELVSGQALTLTSRDVPGDAAVVM